jgi:hypothetical protein
LVLLLFIPSRLSCIAIVIAIVIAIAIAIAIAMMLYCRRHHEATSKELAVSLHWCPQT